jgi:hypothetical protein
MTARTSQTSRIRPRTTRAVAAVLGAALLAAGAAALAGAAPAPHPGLRVDLRVLLLADDGSDGNIQAWEDNLRREGVPFDLVTGATTLTAATFADGDRAKYEAVIVSGANGTDPAGIPLQFSAAEFALLRAFEQKFGIRQLDVNAYPGPPLGLNFPSDSGSLDGQTATLTAAGLAQFPSLKGPVAFEDLSPAVSETFGTLASPCDGVAVPTCNATSYETLLQAPGGASLLGIAQTKDNREEMVSTITANQFQLHDGLLRHGMLGWVTRGIHLGMDRSYLSVDVDDVFLPDDKWNPATKTTPEDSAPGQQDLRMTPGDVSTLVAWQNANGVKLNMLFNGGGVADARDANGGVDRLFNAFMANKAQLSWVNHTFSHLNLDAPATQAQIRSEITQNNQFAATNALPGYNRAELVTGEHSGIGTSNPVTAPNPAMAPALNAAGVTSLGADNSREIGQRAVGNALTLPRYPMNVFYNVSTWADQLDEYDWLYLAKGAGPAGRGNCSNSATTTCFTAPVTQAQFVDREASGVLRHMMGNDPRPHYAHQPNLMSESSNPNVANRGDGILYAVLGAAVSRYRSYYKTPFLQPTHAALTQELARQVAWSAAAAAGRVSAYVQDGKVTISASAAVSVPVTGTTAGDVYGGQRSGWLALSAGQTATLDPDDPRNTAAPVVTGTVSPGATLSTTDGSWTGTPAIAFARQWQRRANATAPWTDITGATGSTYTVTAADAGQTLRAVITAGNRISSWSMAATAPVGPPVAPANTVAPAVSGTAAVGRTLTAGTGTWTGTAPIAYAYQWERSNNGGASWSAISGATARTYAIAASDHGYRIRVRVTASNGVGSTTAFSAAVGPVTSGNPLCGLLGLLC